MTMIFSFSGFVSFMLRLPLKYQVYPGKGDLIHLKFRRQIFVVIPENLSQKYLSLKNFSSTDLSGIQVKNLS